MGERAAGGNSQFLEVDDHSSDNDGFTTDGGQSAMVTPSAVSRFQSNAFVSEFGDEHHAHESGGLLTSINVDASDYDRHSYNITVNLQRA